MKKSKILGISLGAIALTGITVATPLIVTSCSSTPEVSLKNEFLTLHEETKPQGSTIEKEQGSNNWNYYVGSETLSKEQMASVVFDTDNVMTKKEYNSLGFGPTNISFSITYSKNKKDVPLEGPESLDVAFNDSADKSKPQKLEFKFWIMEGTDPKNLTKTVEIPFSVTMIPGTK